MKTLDLEGFVQATIYMYVINNVSAIDLLNDNMLIHLIGI